MKPALLGAIGLLVRSLSVTETAGSLHDDNCHRSQLFYTTLVYVIKTCGMELTGQTSRLLGKLCRGQRVEPYKLLQGFQLSYVDRSAYSGLCVLLGLLETLLDYDQEFLNRNSVDSILSFVLPLRGMSHVLAIKRLKYVTSFWFAKFLHQKELPPNDWDEKQNDHWLFSGSVRRYLRKRMVSVTAKNARLFYSLLQAKRACDPVPETFIQAALEKHRKIIGTPSCPLDDALKLKIEQCTDSIIDSWEGFQDKITEPSHSACWEVGRGVGGQHFALIELFGDSGFLEFLNGSVRIRLLPNDLVAMLYCTKTQRIREVRGWLMPSRLDILRCAFDHEVGGPFTPQGRGQMTCEVATVLEPLKVRTVTKGRALAYYSVHGVQKWMHHCLRSQNVFRLIGQTVDEDIMKELIGWRKPGENLISGDYSAATDNLKLDVTKAIFERILLRLARDLSYSDEAVYLTSLCRKVLYEHIIHYPSTSGLEPVEQRTGQLMGSPLSFPILCLANCICCWISLFPDHRFEELPMLVNGDDISFSCTDERYDLWSNALSGFGFVKSVGKNYNHPRFVIINSEMYDSQYEKTGRCHLPYFNSGLLLGRSRVVKMEQVDGESTPVIGTLEKCLAGSNQPDRTLLRFMAHNHDKVEKVTRRKTNLFLPITRGGHGLKPYGAKYHISLWQRRYASFLSEMDCLRTDQFHRVANEEHQFKSAFRVKWESLPDMTDYEILPSLIDEVGDVVSEVTWLPGLSLLSRKVFLESLHKRSKEYLTQITPCGPAGWRLLDKYGRTEWKTTLSGRKMKVIQKCRPLSGDLQDELSYAYSPYR